ncbi:NADH-quinone oxidoreductase subunit C, partial [Streptomyces tailanensis]|uniref:NADH-quinone oxidoreductase subunit C n=1 Tax=Streptomyces tailanensis TaxID=2569858 RepID=UPI00122E6F78
MTGWLPSPAEELFGPEATAEESYEVLTVDVPPTSWTQALRTAHSTLGCTYFDWLSAVDEPGTGFRVSAHVVALNPVRRLLLRTTVPHESPVLPTAVDVYAGAAWHERETHEMFGVRFEGHPALDHLLLPENFEGHPLRKDFVLAARVAKAWPGAKEPGESEHGGPKRRQMLPPGVPDPNEWGPLKGQLPPAPTRPARGTGPRAATGERPPRRTAAEGSATQPPTTTPAPPRRTRTTAEGSATQRTQPPIPSEPTIPEAQPTPGEQPARPDRTRPTGPRRARTASDGSASQRPTPPEAPASGDQAATPRPTPRSTDAPWHHARPAFEEPEPTPKPKPTPKAEPPSEPEPTPKADPTRGADPTPKQPNDTPDPDTPDPDTPDPDTPDPDT